MVETREKTLFICSTYYHALISVIKVLLSKEKNADILLLDYIEGNYDLSTRIEKTGIFDNVFLVDNRIEEYHPPTRLSRIFCLHYRNKKKIESQFFINFKIYSNIYIFHDGTWIAHYLQNVKTEYILMEDSLDSFKLIEKGVFSELVQKGGIVNFFKNLFHIGYCYLGLSRYTKYIEVNDLKGIFIKKIEKVRVEPRDRMFQRLTEENVEIIKQIFPLKDVFHPNSFFSLLITQPLFEDRYVESYQKQEEIFKIVVEEYFPDNGIFYIKPHPRDKANYDAIFPKAVILDRFFPLEVYNFYNVKFNSVISLFSTAGSSIINAKNSIMIINTKDEKNIKESLERKFLGRQNVL